MRSRIICFGAAHPDIRARALGPIVDGTSNPVETTRARGGVAGNVAAWLATLGHDVSMVTRLGRDPAGDAVFGELAEIPVDCTGISRSSTTPTASYTAALTPSGDLRLGLADMAIYDEITTAMMDQALATIRPAETWFLDTNLPETVIGYLASQAPGTVLIAGDTVSIAKAPRLRAACPRLDLLITNATETKAIFPRFNDADIPARLTAMGIDRAIIGRAHEGVQVVDGDGTRDHASLASRVVDVTGAGDALAAGVLHGILTGLPMDDTIRVGLAAAAFAVENDMALPATISHAALFDRASIGR